MSLVAGMTRDQAWQLLTTHLTTRNLVKHCLASEAIMRALAPRCGGDVEAWGITGLLHDLDLDLVKGDMSRHAELGAQLAAAAGLAPEYCEAIRKHKHDSAVGARGTPLEHALAAAETLTGLIVAAALVLPDKRLASLTTASVVKRLGEARFAAGASRDHIRECAALGLDLEQFCALALAAMQGRAAELGL